MTPTRCLQVNPAGLVVNVILADPAWVPGEGTSLVASATGNPGDSYANGVLTPAAPSAPAVPASVAMWQAKAALQGANLLANANAAVAASNSAALVNFWASAATLERNDPNTVSIGTALGLSAAQMDALFVTAGALAV